MKALALLPLLALSCTPAQRCVTSTPPGYTVRNWRAVEAPPIYRTWWSDVEECLWLHADMGAVDWYASSLLLRGTPKAGLRWGPTITLQQAHQYREEIVKHEAVHAILGQSGMDPDPSHSGPWWDECVGPGENPGGAPVREDG